MKVKSIISVCKTIYKREINQLDEKLYCFILKKHVKNKNFTIISNNCWGGGIYQDLNLPYLTPTVGLFFYAPDYLKFVKNIKYYVDQPLAFISTSKYKAQTNEINYPIGILDDIEIHFQHYHSNEEAELKWNKRKLRINYNNLFLKFCDRDLSTEALMKEFNAINNVKAKVIFTAKEYPSIKSVQFLKDFEGQDTIGDISTFKIYYRKYFDVAKWLNR